MIVIEKGYLNFQFPVAMHAVGSLRNVAAAFPALYKIDRHFFPAVLAFSV